MCETYAKAGRIQIDVNRAEGGFVAKVLVFHEPETGEREGSKVILYKGRSDVDRLEALKRLAEEVGVDWRSVLDTAENGGGK